MDQDLTEVRRIVMSRLRGRARAYLYGSCVRGQAARTSDIDVGIIPLEPIEPSELSELRETLEQSNILWPVELVDLSRTDADFRQHVLREAIEWTG